MFLQHLRYAPNGHSFAIVGDEVYSIMRTHCFKHVEFGIGSDVVWSPSENYASKSSFNNVSVFEGKTNKQEMKIETDFAIKIIFGGPLLQEIAQ